MILYAACDSANLSGNVCTSPVYVAAPWDFSLTLDDASQIAVAIALLWSVAFVFRTLARQVRDS